MMGGPVGAGGRAGWVSPVVAGMLDRVADPAAWRAWQRQVEHTGYCVRPIRVRGGAAAVDTATGEVVASYSTEGGPDGTLLLACKDRRERVCPPCAETYRRDTWHVVAAGLRGRAATAEGGLPGLAGAGADAVPLGVAEHPAVFATFTAPSFGRVHGRRNGAEVCRAAQGRPVCAHGAPLWCHQRHGTDDHAGQPLCYHCYDYDGHVLWHASVPELWRRTTIYVYRALARHASARLGERVTVRAVRGLLRVSYVKVAEFQRRAAVHLHGVLRLDGVDADDPGRITAPPAWADTALLEAALREAASRVEVALPTVGGIARVARWGPQLDVTPIGDPARTAAYVAKYATKTAGDVLAGLPPHRFGVAELGWLRRRGASAHVLLLVAACFRLAKRADCAGFRLRDYPHTLGFRGHFATKSRRYSVTLTVLRAVRRSWRMATSRTPEGGAGAVWAADPDSTVIVSEWRYLGSGWARAGDAQLAASLARDRAALREVADIAAVCHYTDREGEW